MSTSRGSSPAPASRTPRIQTLPPGLLELSLDGGSPYTPHRLITQWISTRE